MFIVVFVTVPNLKSAKRIAKGLLEKRLCACVNIAPGLKSFFWWQGKIDKAKELLLIIKTRKSLFNKLKHAVLNLHPYDVPEVIALPITAASEKYAAWLRKETKNA
ncbi:divalent-cation tolerance protein CutA [Candidatus Omnitrophota bacterium]